MPRQRRAKRRNFVVQVGMPPGVTPEEMREYISDAVRWWCKQYFPGGIREDTGDYVESDPIFNLEPESVIVRTGST